MSELSQRVQEWHQAGNTFNFQNQQIFYLDNAAQDKPVLVLLHGFPTSSFDWIDVWSALDSQYRLIAMDFLGFGLSDKPRQHTYTIAEQTNIQEALLQKLAIKKYHVLAHDYGTTVAQELLARHQEKALQGQLLSVTFLNGGILPDWHRPRLIQKLLLTPIGWLLSRLLSQRTFNKSFAAVFAEQTQPTQQQLEDFWSLICYKGGHRIAHRLMNYVPERKQFKKRWVGAMKTSLPIKVINGLEDPVSGRHMMDVCRKQFPELDMTLLEDVGHYPQTEAPQAVLSAFQTFMQKTGVEG
ncbi:alpha/beta fold hydrolase [Marinicella sp. W31]|uniref:alpha/beta fold hydrolase n=1 Tax=Marinicella sp. W31 TaxID=3023713 RepID=UPI00375730CF